jgi:CO/xanthine dehydrogenase FAD-binding subunit
LGGEKIRVFHQLEEFLYPEDLRQAVEKKHEYGDCAAAIAGGTEIVPNLPREIRCLIDVTRLGLSYVDSQPDLLRIGATTTMQELALSPALAQVANGLLSVSCCQGWPQQVRTTATIGGNLVGGGPFADSPPALLALDAQAVVARLEGEETIALEDFFLDYRRTAVGLGILKEIRIPRPEPGTRGIFLKSSRSPVDQALVNLAVTIKLEASYVRKVRLALGAVGRIPHRLLMAEQALLNRPLDEHSIESACSLVTEMVDPILDLRASADYRRQLAGKLTRQALLQIAS